MEKAKPTLTPAIKIDNQTLSIQCPKCNRLHNLILESKNEYRIIRKLLYPQFVCDSPKCKFAGILKLDIL